MKKTLFLLLFVFGIFMSSVFGQLSAKYSVTAFNQPYDTLVNATNLSAGVDWGGDEWFSIYLPFTFQFMGQPYDSLWVDTNGNIYFPADFDDYDVVVQFFNSPLVDLGHGQSNISPILYKVVGNTGNRIAKIEIRNAGFDYDNTETMKANVQVWLYEKDNVVEVHYGSITGLLDYFDYWDGDVEPEFICGLFTYSYDLDEVTSTHLTGSTTNPDTTRFMPNAQFLDWPNLDTIPSTGQVYRFFPPSISSSLNSANISELHLSPNPATSSTNLKVSLAQPSNLNISLHSLTGTSLKTWTYSNLSGANELNLDVQGLASGVYVLKCDTGTEVVSRRLVIK